jgi:hypothetical protein
MSKQKKFILDIENTEPFEMIGIGCHFPDYRLAFNINESLDIQLAKEAQDFIIGNKKNPMISVHPYFVFKDDEFLVEYYLIKNKHLGKFLIPEHPMLDYFLFLTNNYHLDLEEIINKLRANQNILSVFAFDPEKIKSTENLIFE